MRPILLEIEGLQSFCGSQTIDFMNLSDTGLFGIFGPTGSGKSTILDAITLTLYGKIQRAGRGNHGIINIGMDTAKVSFVFELSGSTGYLNGSTRYRIDRIYSRKKGSESACEPKIARLLEDRNGVLIPVCDKTTEVNSKIEELLGLNYDDFTRAVVLPQGRFQEFLMLDNAKKREMLERIFYLDEYGGRLNDKLQRRIIKLNDILSGLEGSLSALADASDEALEEACSNVKNALIWRDASLILYNDSLLKFEDAKEVWQLEIELTDTVKKGELLREKESEIEENKNILNRSLKAADLEVYINNLNSLSIELENAGESLKHNTGRQDKAKETAKKAKSDLINIKNEAAQNQPFLIERRTKLTEALNIAEEILKTKENLKLHNLNYKKYDTAFMSKSYEIKTFNDTLKSKIIELNDLKIQLNEFKVEPAYRRSVTDGANIEAQLAKYSVNSAAVEKRIKNGNKYLEDLRAEIKVLDNKAQNNGILVKQRENITLIGQLAKTIVSLEQRSEELTKMIEKQKCTGKDDGILLSQAALRLAGELKDGQPCPVCGSREHPEIKTDSDYLVLSTDQMSFIEEQLKAVYNEFQENMEIFIETKKLLPDKYINFSAGDLLLTLDDIKADNRNEITAAEEIAETLRKKKELEISADAGLKHLIETLKNINYEIQENNNKLNEIKKLLPPGITASGELAAIIQKDNKSAEYSANINSLEKEIEYLKQKTEDITGSLNDLILKRSEALAAINSETNIETGLMQKYSDMAGELKPEALKNEIKKINNSLESYSLIINKCEKDLTDAEKELSELDNKIAGLKSRISVYEGEMVTNNSKLSEMLPQSGFTCIAQAMQAILPKVKSEELKNEITSYETEKTEYQSRTKLIKEKLKDRSIDEKTWLSIKEMHIKAVEDREKSISAYNIAKNQYEILSIRNEKWKECEELRQKNDRARCLYLQIQKLLRAEKGKDNSFIDFIAEERLRYAAAKASEILGHMTDYKYALELDPDSGFIIRDNANGGVYRPVSTLSGGEIFLVSLSLALSLSEQIQLKGKNSLEFFFLDEGFGTLDLRLLDTVADSLERISRKDRVIGLISHVPELQKRIARRLVIEPPSSQNRGSWVRIERG